MNFLAIETSCDETAVAIFTDEPRVLANVVASQTDLHARFGGVVPEIASRHHLELVLPVIREALAEAGSALDDVETVAVTRGPGLIGALLVGLSAAKALAWAKHLPLVPVDHLQGLDLLRPNRREITAHARTLPRSCCANARFL